MTSDKRGRANDREKERVEPDNKIILAFSQCCAENVEYPVISGHQSHVCVPLYPHYAPADMMLSCFLNSVA